MSAWLHEVRAGSILEGLAHQQVPSPTSPMFPNIASQRLLKSKQCNAEWPQTPTAQSGPMLYFPWRNSKQKLEFLFHLKHRFQCFSLGFFFFFLGWYRMGTFQTTSSCPEEGDSLAQSNPDTAGQAQAPSLNSRKSITFRRGWCRKSGRTHMPSWGMRQVRGHI